MQCIIDNSISANKYKGKKEIRFSTE